jgi:hypothetical protein
LEDHFLFSSVGVETLLRSLPAMPDRPPLLTNDIEVTPEMIEAGIATMWEFNLDGFDPAEWRKAIRAGFYAMVEAQKVDFP